MYFDSFFTFVMVATAVKYGMRNDLRAYAILILMENSVLIFVKREGLVLLEC